MASKILVDAARSDVSASSQSRQAALDSYRSQLSEQNPSIYQLYRYIHLAGQVQKPD